MIGVVVNVNLDRQNAWGSMLASYVGKHATEQDIPKKAVPQHAGSPQPVVECAPRKADSTLLGQSFFRASQKPKRNSLHRGSHELGSVLVGSGRVSLGFAGAEHYLTRSSMWIWKVHPLILQLKNQPEPSCLPLAAHTFLAERVTMSAFES